MFRDVLLFTLFALVVYIEVSILMWTIFDIYFTRKMKFFRDLTKIFSDAAENMLEKSKENKDGNC